jgi:hypothetical protein
MQDQPAEPRKIIQTSVIQDTEITHCNIVALCNDGTLWTQSLGTGVWHQEVAIPQPKVSL